MRAFSSLKHADGPIFVRSAPGSRTFELAQPDEGNQITEDILKTLSQYIQKIEENYTVGVMMLASRSPDRFSDGLVRTSLGVPKETVKAANALSLTLSTMNKDSVAVYSGSFDDTAYSTFAACKVISELLSLFCVVIDCSIDWELNPLQ